MVPAGTAMLLRTIVAQDLADALAADAAVNVHEVARLSRETDDGSYVGAAAASASSEERTVNKRHIVAV